MEALVDLDVGAVMVDGVSPRDGSCNIVLVWYGQGDGVILIQEMEKLMLHLKR